VNTLIPQILNYLALLIAAIGFLVLGFRLRGRKPRTARIAVIIGCVQFFNFVAGLLFLLALSRQWLVYPEVSGEFDFSAAIYVGVIWAISLPTCLGWLLAGYGILERPDRRSIAAGRHAADEIAG